MECPVSPIFRFLLSFLHIKCCQPLTLSGRISGVRVAELWQKTTHQDTFLKTSKLKHASIHIWIKALTGVASSVPCRTDIRSFLIYDFLSSSPVHADTHIKLVQTYWACCPSPFSQALRSNSSDFHGLTQFPSTGSWPDHRGVQLHWLILSGHCLCNGSFQSLLPTDTRTYKLCQIHCQSSRSALPHPAVFLPLPIVIWKTCFGEQIRP